MNLLQTCKLALKSILSNKMRAFLTMLGIIIGVASVITLTGLVGGVKEYIIDSFSDMGTNMITVSVTNTGTRKADLDFMYELVDENNTLFEGVTPKVTGSFTIKKDTTSETNKTVTGVDESYVSINHLTMQSGRFINYADTLTRNKVCVLGTYYVDELFTTRDIVGETIKIDGDVYTVIGILKEQEDSTESSADDCIFIPYSNACRMTFSSEATSFVFATYSTDDIAQAETILDNALYEVFKDESLYKVNSMTALLETVNSMTSLISGVLGGIAGISLLVAGIGIMNIMLVSVIERTREIGIRKAIGAKRRHIMSQFVLEAAIISSLGGIIGIIIGAVATTNIANLFGISAFPSTQSIIMAFSIAAGIGVFFGYMPARRAAKLNPIEALRSE